MTSNRLHDSLINTESLIHVSATGAGMRLQTALWDTPGASPYLVGFFTPYAQTQQWDFLGFEPDAGYCSKEVAFDMAMASYMRAAEHRTTQELWQKNPVGVGVTASVATTRIPRGDQRVHVAFISRDAVDYFVVVLKKDIGKEARQRQDADIALAVLERLVDFIGAPFDQFFKGHTDYALARFFLRPLFKVDGTRRGPEAAPFRSASVYLPASLNPIHAGHRYMCDAAEVSLKKPSVRYLISTTPLQKPPLKLQDILGRAGMLRAERWNHTSRDFEFTRGESLFLDMARSRPGSTFLIGADNMVRLLNPKWGPEIGPMLREMEELEVHFLVTPRVVDGETLSLHQIAVPPQYSSLFTPIGGRYDISSTELRLSGHGV